MNQASPLAKQRYSDESHVVGKTDCPSSAADTRPPARMMPCTGRREYPLDWILRQIKKAGMVTVSAKKMSVLYAPHTIKRQVLKMPYNVL